MEVEEFYDNISNEYTDMLDRAVPKYREMLWLMLHYIPANFKPKRILELGSGTGNLTELVLEKFPDAEITVVDISEKILDECKARFQSSNSINYCQYDFKEIEFEIASFDLILSSIAIHHIEDVDKQILFRKINSYLKPKGIFTYLDQCMGETTEIYQKNMKMWKTAAFKLGSTKENWKTWMDHQDEHDFHATVKNQIKWLEESSFKNIDILWRNLLWTVFYSEKKNKYEKNPGII